MLFRSGDDEEGEFGELCVCVQLGSSSSKLRTHKRKEGVEREESEKGKGRLGEVLAGPHPKDGGELTLRAPTNPRAATKALDNAQNLPIPTKARTASSFTRHSPSASERVSSWSPPCSHHR